MLDALAARASRTGRSRSAYAFLGHRCRAGRDSPPSHSLTGSVPVSRAGMASGTADLQRDLGGAIMQSVLGALLAAGYATAIGRAIAAAPHHRQITASIQNQLEKSFAGARAMAQRYPHYSSKITAAAKSAFLAGDKWAYAAGIGAVLLGAAVVFFLFPKKEQEESCWPAITSRTRAGEGQAASGRTGVKVRATVVALPGRA